MRCAEAAGIDMPHTMRQLHHHADQCSRRIHASTSLRGARTPPRRLVRYNGISGIQGFTFSARKYRNSAMFMLRTPLWHRRLCYNAAAVTADSCRMQHAAHQKCHYIDQWYAQWFARCENMPNPRLFVLHMPPV
jgi:hypothetical protein